MKDNGISDLSPELAASLFGSEKSPSQISIPARQAGMLSEIIESTARELSAASGITLQRATLALQSCAIGIEKTTGAITIDIEKFVSNCEELQEERRATKRIEQQKVKERLKALGRKMRGIE